MDSIPNPAMFLSYGGRPTKGNGRKRKGVDDYAAENRIDFTSRSIVQDGQLVKILVCRFCYLSISARSDRIKEHLSSKRHKKLKLEAFREASEVGRDLNQEYTNDSLNGILPEQPINISLRHGTQEMSSGIEGRKSVMSSSPSLKERSLNSSPPSQQQLHTGGLHGGLQSSVAKMSGGVRLSAGPNSAERPPPQGQQQQQQHQVKEQSPPTQLLCVRWEHFNSNIVSMFTKLRAQEHFIDVTLWCDEMTIKCHKIVLSSCSTYFEKLLTENPNPHPIIFLKDMEFLEVTTLVEFMYRGEVRIHPDKLQSLLQAAESLQIKGLGYPAANDKGAGGIRCGSLEENSGLDDDLFHGTIDMSTTSLNNNNSLSNKNNNNHNNNQSSNSSNHNNSNNNNGESMSHRHNDIREYRALHGAMACSLNQAQLHTVPSATAAAAAVNAHSVHIYNSTPLLLSNIHCNTLPLVLAFSSALHNNNYNSNMHQNQSGPCAKRRKKETPRRIDIPIRPKLSVPVFSSNMASEQIENDFYDSMAAHVRNCVEAFKQDAHPDKTYKDEEEEQGQDICGERDASQMEDDQSDSQQGGELEEEMERGDCSDGLQKKQTNQVHCSNE